MGTTDSQFIATGGEDEERNMGFFTDPSQDDDGAQMDFGVNVQGNVCGVYAESLLTPKLMADRRPHNTSENVGVFSIGENFGVIGEANTGIGVSGNSYSKGSGIEGTSFDDKEGVIGISISHSAHSLPLGMGEGAGVQGLSGNGIGVRGESRRFINSTIPNHNPDPTKHFLDFNMIDGEGIGVQGISGHGTGVHGYSTSGDGVKGESVRNRAGVFKSGSIAQVQLMPAPLLADNRTSAPLPSSHGAAQAGDLFSRLVVVSDQGNVRVIQAELWFCIQPTDLQSNDPILWAKVLLDTPTPPM